MNAPHDDTPLSDQTERKGFSYEKSQRIEEKALALSAWFKARGEKPEEWMDLFSEILVSDEPLTESEIRHAWEIAKKLGWQVDSGIAACSCTGGTTCIRRTRSLTRERRARDV